MSNEISYTIENYNPEGNFLRVRYHHDDLDDVIEVFNPGRFTEEAVNGCLKVGAARAIVRWERMQDPQEQPVAVSKTGVQAIKEVVYEEPPEHDERTQYLEDHVYEDDTRIVHTYRIMEKSAEEIANDLLLQHQSNRSALKAQRIAYQESPINGFQVGRPVDRENIQGTIDNHEMLMPNGTISWTMDDNTVREVTLDELKDVLRTYIVRKARVNYHFQILATRIEHTAYGTTITWPNDYDPMVTEEV